MQARKQAACRSSMEALFTAAGPEGDISQPSR